MRGNRKIERLSIRWRLILITFLVIVLAVVIIAVFLSLQSYRALSNQLMEAHGQLVSFSAESISNRIDEALRVADLVLSQGRVTGALTRAESRESYPLSEQLDDAKWITSFLKSLQDSSNLVRVRLQLCGDTLYANEQINFFRMPQEERARLGNLMREGRFYEVQTGTFDYIFRNPRRVLSVMRTAVGGRSFFTVIGAVAVDVDAQEIEGLMQGILVNEGDAAVLYNREGRAVYALGDDSLAALPAAGGETGRWTRQPAALVYELPVGPDGWTLSYRVRSDALYLPVHRMMLNMLWVLAAALAVALGLAVASGTAQSRRLLRLARAMDQVRSGEMSVRVEEGPGNEIGRMERSFNFLLDELQQSIEAKLSDARQLGLMELRLLQSQINPHFLYNTLNLICWRLTKNGDEEGARYVQALAQFYRIGLNHGKELIALEEELRHVQLYVEMQNFRVDGKIRLSITLTPDCRRVLMPGNILQPLVENAINAGILEKPEGSGTVAIDCRKENGDLVIVVSDDGVGMDVAAMEERLRGEYTQEHYGAWNVHKRLLLRYGEGYGLRYSLNPSGGVDVRVRLRA
ncbi:MAG: histidine kinase [bacterium]|nr:histidine kinase [bacterium]